MFVDFVRYAQAFHRVALLVLVKVRIELDKRGASEKLRTLTVAASAEMSKPLAPRDSHGSTMKVPWSFRGSPTDVPWMPRGSSMEESRKHKYHGRVRIKYTPLNTTQSSVWDARSEVQRNPTEDPRAVGLPRNHHGLPTEMFSIEIPLLNYGSMGPRENKPSVNLAYDTIKCCEGSHSFRTERRSRFRRRSSRSTSLGEHHRK